MKTTLTTKTLSITIIALLFGMMAATPTAMAQTQPRGQPAGWTPFTISPQTVTEIYTSYETIATENTLIQKITFNLAEPITATTDGGEFDLTDITGKVTVVWPGWTPELDPTDPSSFVGLTGYSQGNMHGTLEVDGKELQVAFGIRGVINDIPASFPLDGATSDNTFIGTRIRGTILLDDYKPIDIGVWEAELSGDGFIKMLN